jgi:hypothetical protein
MLAVGATYSLARANELLPGAPGEFREHAVNLLTAVSQGDVAGAASPTWSLGYYLNSTESRIQAAVHRIVRAYTGKGGKAFPLIEEIEALPAAQRPAEQAMRVLRDVKRRPADSAIARVWVRGNSVKHDPAQDVSDQFNFAARSTDARTAISDLISLIDILGPR